MFNNASLRSSFRRNAVIITRSSSLSPTPVVVDSDSQSLHNSQKTSPRDSPTQFIDNPALISRSDSLPSNHVHKRSPVLMRQSKVPSKESPTKELENSSNDVYFVPIHRSVSTLSTNSYSSTNSYNSSNSQNPSIGSPSAVQKNKPAVAQGNQPTNQNTTNGTTSGQRVSNFLSRRFLTNHNALFLYSIWC